MKPDFSALVRHHYEVQGWDMSDLDADSMYSKSVFTESVQYVSTRGEGAEAIHRVRIPVRVYSASGGESHVLFEGLREIEVLRVLYNPDGSHPDISSPYISANPTAEHYAATQLSHLEYVNNGSSIHTYQIAGQDVMLVDALVIRVTHASALRHKLRLLAGE